MAGENGAGKVDGAVEFSFPDEQDGKVPDAPAAQAQEDEGDETDVEIVDDVPEKDRGHKPGVSRDIPDVTDEELASYAEEKFQKRIKELSFARHDERRAKEAALRERQEMERVTHSMLEENKRLKSYVKTGEAAYVDTSKAAAKAKLEIAKSKYRAAHEAFDAEALISAQQELTTAQLELSAAENFRPLPLQSEKEEANLQGTEQPSPPDDRALRWRQRNEWFGEDDEMTALALATHKRLVNSGVDPRSDEYYKRIDARVREKFPENFEKNSGDDNPAEQAQPHRKPATVVAATARSSSAKKITLTQTQVNLAKKLGIPLADYAKQVALLENR